MPQTHQLQLPLITPALIREKTKYMLSLVVKGLLNLFYRGRGQGVEEKPGRKGITKSTGDSNNRKRDRTT